MEPLGLRKSPPDLLGPGRMVLIVGPSGAGKDTLISGARLQCANEPAVVFPRRVVTRPSSAYEDHHTVDLATFNRAVAEGKFALWWAAHGHLYGIPVSIDHDIRLGRTVICNVSRTVVDQTRRRYALVSVVLITAPQHILKERLTTRERGSDGNLAARVAHSATVEETCRPDYVIHNSGPVSTGISQLTEVIRKV